MQQIARKLLATNKIKGTETVTAFVIKDNLGAIKKGWILQGGRPSLSYHDLQLIEKQNCYLIEASVEEVLTGIAFDQPTSLSPDIIYNEMIPIPHFEVL